LPIQQAYEELELSFGEFDHFALANGDYGMKEIHSLAGGTEVYCSETKTYIVGHLSTVTVMAGDRQFSTVAHLS
jgi:hypothetical protein